MAMRTPSLTFTVFLASLLAMLPAGAAAEGAPDDIDPARRGLLGHLPPGVSWLPSFSAYVGGDITLSPDTGSPLESKGFCWSASTRSGVDMASDACWREGGSTFNLTRVTRLGPEIVVGVVVLGESKCVMVKDGDVHTCDAVCYILGPLSYAVGCRDTQDPEAAPAGLP